jgi:hypothetical protein
MINHMRHVKRRSKVTKRQKNLLTADMWPLLRVPETKSSIAYCPTRELKLYSGNKIQNMKDITRNFIKLCGNAHWSYKKKSFTPHFSMPREKCFIITKGVKFSPC